MNLVTTFARSEREGIIEAIRQIKNLQQKMILIVPIVHKEGMKGFHLMLRLGESVGESFSRRSCIRPPINVSLHLINGSSPSI